MTGTRTLEIDGVTITGASSGSDPAIDISGRDAKVENCCIELVRVTGNG